MYDRRQFLRFLAASPLLASAGFTIDPFNLVPRQNTIDASLLETLDKTGGNVITSADQALDVMEFEPVARKVLPPAHFGYLATGVDDDATVRANSDGFKNVQIRSRRLVNVEKLDTSVRIFGTTWPTPIFL